MLGLHGFELCDQHIVQNPVARVFQFGIDWEPIALVRIFIQYAVARIIDKDVIVLADCFPMTRQ